jgi:uncharacterized protein YjiS (DUF1127 family)
MTMAHTSLVVEQHHHESAVLRSLRHLWAETKARIAEERRDRALRRDLQRLSPRMLRDIGMDV